MSYALALSPSGRLTLEQNEEAEPRLRAAAGACLVEAFAASSAQGIESLVSSLLHEPVPPTLAFWRGLGARYFTALCHNAAPDNPEAPSVPRPGPETWTAMAEGAPPMKGLEYLTGDVLARAWDELDAHARSQIDRIPGGAAAYLKARNPAWHAVGRVTFHMAENKRNPAYPFAFLATYTHRISDLGKVQHLPLGRALEEYAGSRNRAALSALLSPVQRAAEKSQVARKLLDSRAIFQPQVWRPDQAFEFLKDIPLIEECGVVVRMPDWWKAGRPPRPQVSVRVGETLGGSVGADSLLDFKVSLSLEGEPLTDAEIQSILQSTSGLVLLKGKWVEVDREKLEAMVDHWGKIREAMDRDGLTFHQAMRLLSGFEGLRADDAATETARADWSNVTAGAAFQALLDQLTRPGQSAESDPAPDLRAALRPYQRQGAHWLWFMNRLGLGACLADDMGLGKTIQVISLLLVLKRHGHQPTATTGREARGTDHRPSLLIVPASLIANWKSELLRFAPSLSVFYAHPSETPAEKLGAAGRTLGSGPGQPAPEWDLVITSYSMALRLEWLKEREWDVVVIDEAQAIKNPAARQSRIVKELRCRHRIALSGTPIENRLSDLWSLFDFLCPGLLGGAKDFSRFLKSRPQTDPNPFAPLRRLVRPYILRRLKTDKRVISDLPEKTEMTAYCGLSRRQAALYRQSVTELAERLESPGIEAIQRRGLILAFLTRFKQICNHPSQWLGDGAYAPEDSGKFQRLRELAEEIASRQEKALVFTQYREMTDPLARYLARVFGRPGLVLHGGTPVGKRKELVDAFQRDGGPPFFVLSLKAGGTGLNLTAASHVVHFDRWWNPAVENQATDRAFRIGQRRNVMVHKFTCRGTLEERIHELIAGKTALAEDILGEGAERLLTEMTNAELLGFVALDIKAAAGD